MSPNENNRRAEAFRALLATPPQAGTDAILVTHYPNIIAALGKDWFDVKEGEASIFRPENGSISCWRAFKWMNGLVSPRLSNQARSDNAW